VTLARLLRAAMPSRRRLKSGDGLIAADLPLLVTVSDGVMAKQSALFNEFRETGTSEKLGYKSVADLRDNYPDFFWQKVRPYIGDALRHLRITQEGRQWVANLYANVFLDGA
jgi:hypothetical protein